MRRHENFEKNRFLDGGSDRKIDLLPSAADISDSRANNSICQSVRLNRGVGWQAPAAIREPHNQTLSARRFHELATPTDPATGR
jgi:hypothetical protein